MKGWKDLGDAFAQQWSRLIKNVCNQSEIVEELNIPVIGT